MRSVGFLETTRGLSSHDHLCWSFTDPGAYAQQASWAVSDGIAADRRMEYIGSATVDDLRAELAGIDEVDALIDRGQIRLTSLSQAYDHDAVIDPDAQVARYDRCTQEALADGYSGYGAVAEATELVRSPHQRAAFLRYEHLIDRYMTEQPFSAVCAYDATVLGEQVIAELASLHPLTNSDEARFQVFAGAHADLVLVGEVDFANVELLDRSLHTTGPRPQNSELVVDAHGVGFIDHRGLLALSRLGEQLDCQVAVHTHMLVVARMAEILHLPSIRVVHEEPNGHE